MAEPEGSVVLVITVIQVLDKKENEGAGMIIYMFYLGRMLGYQFV